MQLHKLHNVDHITVHFTRSYYPKHQNFNGTCLLEGFLCRKARKKIVKKNWKKRWFRLFAVGDNYSVLVYVFRWHLTSRTVRVVAVRFSSGWCVKCCVFWYLVSGTTKTVKVRKSKGDITLTANVSSLISITLSASMYVRLRLGGLSFQYFRCCCSFWLTGACGLIL